MAPPRLGLFYNSPAQLNALGTLAGRTRFAGVNLELANKDRSDGVIGDASWGWAERPCERPVSKAKSAFCS